MIMRFQKSKNTIGQAKINIQEDAASLSIQKQRTVVDDKLTIEPLEFMAPQVKGLNRVSISLDQRHISNPNQLPLNPNEDLSPDDITKQINMLSCFEEEQKQEFVESPLQSMKPQTESDGKPFITEDIVELYKNDKIRNLKVSSGDKKRLQKRKEIVRSMKFLRKLGKKLREEMEKQYQIYKKFHKSQQRKQAKLRKQERKLDKIKRKQTVQELQFQKSSANKEKLKQQQKSSNALLFRGELKYSSPTQQRNDSYNLLLTQFKGEEISVSKDEQMPFEVHLSVPQKASNNKVQSQTCRESYGIMNQSDSLVESSGQQVSKIELFQQKPVEYKVQQEQFFGVNEDDLEEYFEEDSSLSHDSKKPSNNKPEQINLEIKSIKSQSGSLSDNSSESQKKSKQMAKVMTASVLKPLDFNQQDSKDEESTDMIFHAKKYPSVTLVNDNRPGCYSSNNEFQIPNEFQFLKVNKFSVAKKGGSTTPNNLYRRNSLTIGGAETFSSNGNLSNGAVEELIQNNDIQLTLHEQAYQQQIQELRDRTLSCITEEESNADVDQESFSVIIEAKSVQPNEQLRSSNQVSIKSKDKVKQVISSDGKSSSILSNDEDQDLYQNRVSINRKSLSADHFELQKSEVCESSESLSQKKLMPEIKMMKLQDQGSSYSKSISPNVSPNYADQQRGPPINLNTVLEPVNSSDQKSPDRGNSSSELVSSHDSEISREFNQEKKEVLVKYPVQVDREQEIRVNSSDSISSASLSSDIESSDSQCFLSDSISICSMSDFKPQSGEDIIVKKKQKLEKEITEDEAKMKVFKNSPMLKRDQFDGEDSELSEIEEFILMEIEQQQNADLMIRLKREEFEIKKKIDKEALRVKRSLKQSKTFNEADLKNTLAENSHIKNLKMQLQRHETKKQFFAFNVYKNFVRKVSDHEIFQQPDPQDELQNQRARENSNRMRLIEKERTLQNLLVEDDSSNSNVSVSSKSLTDHPGSSRPLSEGYRPKQRSNTGMIDSSGQRKMNVIGKLDSYYDKKDKSTPLSLDNIVLSESSGREQTKQEEEKEPEIQIPPAVQQPIVESFKIIAAPQIGRRGHQVTQQKNQQKHIASDPISARNEAPPITQATLAIPLNESERSEEVKVDSSSISENQESSVDSIPKTLAPPIIQSQNSTQREERQATEVNEKSQDKSYTFELKKIQTNQLSLNSNKIKENSSQKVDYSAVFSPKNISVQQHQKIMKDVRHNLKQLCQEFVFSPKRAPVKQLFTVQKESVATTPAFVKSTRPPESQRKANNVSQSSMRKLLEVNEKPFTSENPFSQTTGKDLVIQEKQSSIHFVPSYKYPLTSKHQLNARMTFGKQNSRSPKSKSPKNKRGSPVSSLNNSKVKQMRNQYRKFQTQSVQYNKFNQQRSKSRSKSPKNKSMIYNNAQQLIISPKSSIKSRNALSGYQYSVKSKYQVSEIHQTHMKYCDSQESLLDDSKIKYKTQVFDMKKYSTNSTKPVSRFNDNRYSCKVNQFSPSNISDHNFSVNLNKPHQYGRGTKQPIYHQKRNTGIPSRYQHLLDMVDRKSNYKY